LKFCALMLPLCGFLPLHILNLGLLVCGDLMIPLFYRNNCPQPKFLRFPFILLL